jgi:hypothetical protein
MKRIIISIATCAILFSANVASAQSSIMLDGSLYDIVFSWKKNPLAKEAHWAGLSFAFSNLVDLPGNINLRLERSYSISWNVNDWEVPVHPHWLLVSGFGFDWSRYHFDGNAGIRNFEGITDFFHDERELKDSKLLIYYGKIPLLLEYQTRIHKKTFFIQGGAEGLIKLYSKSRIEVKNHNHVDKEDFRNLKIYPINMRFFLHAGFSNFGIFGYYQPFSIFQQGHGPELRSFGVGIALN